MQSAAFIWRTIWVVAILIAAPLARARAETATIYRDEFGVPHIYAETLRGAAHAAGYAQAEDRLEELLKNYRKAAGTMSEAFGDKHIQHDYRQRLWQHERIARERFGEISLSLQDACRGYIRGIERFMREHPEQVPDWAPKLEAYYPIMLGRYIIWAWPERQAAHDLREAGIEPDKVTYRGSNEWLVAPGRTKLGVPIALVDPHLGWYGEFRFYEQRMYATADEVAISGACILGVPMPALGHSQYASIAMTTGGPDTADVYEETVNADNALQYQVDGQWRDMTVREEVLRVKLPKGTGEQRFELAYTHHGPVVARRASKAYTMAIPYFEQVGLFDELANVMRGKNLDEIKRALSTCQLMPQNVMIGTVDGDLYYLRTGRVPIRKHGLPTDRPIPGNTSQNDYAGIHPLEDLVQIVNPASGYMQNCNISPLHMMKNSTLTPEKYPQYIYNAGTGPAHQRGQMVLELLEASTGIGVEEAIDLAFSTRVLGAEAWQARLESAWNGLPAEKRAGDAKVLFDHVQGWNRRSDADSIGAFAFYMFKRALPKGSDEAVDVPAELTDSQITDALAQAAATMRRDFRRLDVRYGDFFRVGRTGGSAHYPVGGGTVANAGMATPRAIMFSREGDVFVGRGGQTSTQIVILSKPPRSYMVLPLGQSDHPESGHWDDQAQKLFSAAKAKDTYFMDRERLLPHVTRTTTLEL